ncbi:peptidase domain-containing ABC transporter [uncultured Xanthomonas sp.]|uniref:peptidase domain-containing ABC transporter n=1 Tax=uncultured Xanthomonas sp. TaxID=152831 RepID=UPI0025E94F8B|nr:peptidase domain-containing ABC transporter [uncultured Xanthomonas sp.]
MADDSGFINWSQKRRVELVMQSEGAECGLACLTMISKFHGHNIDLPSLRRRFSSSLKGITLARMIDIANELSFECRPLKAELEYLSFAKLPCIAHWDLNHFVVIAATKKNKIVIFDPARGLRKITYREASDHFTGVLLELEPSTDFTPQTEVRHITLKALTGKIYGLKRTITQIIILAIGIEALALATPLQLQLTIDQFTASNDTNILLIISISFALIVITQALLSIARAWIISWLGANINSQWVTNMFSHLLRLPLEFFEKRHLGDILSRFSSIYTIQSTLTGSFLSAILDGLTGILALLLLISYSPALTFFAVTMTCTYSLLRAIMFKSLWSANEQSVVYAARQQTELMESVRGIQAIKISKKQAERKSRLSNSTMEAAKRQLSAQRIELGFNTANQGIFGLQRVVLIAACAYMVSKGQLSPGMLVAFVAYADQFSLKTSTLVDKLIEFKMLRLHLLRISDIALESPENPVTFINKKEKGNSGNIHIENVSHRYSDDEPWVIKNLSLEITRGESLAIVGPSGCGKSTLAKLILGLLAPTQGTIRFGNSSSLAITPVAIAAVMQDDNLFSGSIADNIAFFDSDADKSKIEEAARLAAIHNEINIMPMGYETLVGDMGSTLSGGQKQRLLLARALYRKPQVLVLDEASSHLDAENEALINKTIKDLNITRIVIAHRKETIEQADRIFDLSLSMSIASRSN